MVERNIKIEKIPQTVVHDSNFADIYLIENYVDDIDEHMLETEHLTQPDS